VRTNFHRFFTIPYTRTSGLHVSNTPHRLLTSCFVSFLIHRTSGSPLTLRS
jgi:hypothetical protein